MRVIIIAFLAAFIISACNSANKSPDIVTYKTNPSESEDSDIAHIGMNENYVGAITGKHPGLDSLVSMQYVYLNARDEFDIDRYRQIWNEFRSEITNRSLSQEEIFAYIDLTGFLFQLTADAIVAEELDQIAWQYVYGNAELAAEPLLLPYAITRHTDNVHINLYLPSAIEFTHSLGGKIKIMQETSFPNEELVLVKLEVETKQYLELFVRIPSWATNAEVIVKGVKYLAEPGTYSKIAKKWIDGDAVELYIPLNNLPEYITARQ